MNISSVTFGKTYISKTPVRNNKTGKKEYFDFVQYDTKKDIETIEKTSEKWKEAFAGGGIYTGFIAEHMKGNIPQNKNDVRYYGIEDSKGNIQAVCEVEFDKTVWPKETNKIVEDIIYMETNPINAYGSKNRTYSKLGVSMFLKLVEFAKQENADKIELTDSSYGFWDKMPFFENSRFRNTVFLKRKNYDMCMKKLDGMI